jgi:hypothetical protein
MTDWKNRITVDPNILVAKPVIKGTRISVELIMDRLADGWTMKQILESLCPYRARGCLGGDMGQEKQSGA